MDGLHKWEQIAEDSLGSTTHRMKIPGGSLYSILWLAEPPGVGSPSAAAALAFVPDPPISDAKHADTSAEWDTGESVARKKRSTAARRKYRVRPRKQ